MMFRKLKLRGNLIRAFKTAEIYRSSKRGDRTVFMYPKIHAIDDNATYTRYTFSLLNGIDPELLNKKMWALRQVLGSNLEIKGSLKNFTITLHHQNLPKLVKYDYDDLKPEIERMELPVVVGKSIYGKYISYDMAELETLLVSGEIGAGKSSLLRAILTTLIKSNSPDELRLVLADLKRADLGLFHGVEHVDSLSFEAKEMIKPFKQLRSEMYRRGDLLLEHGVTHIKGLPFKLPRIVTVVDEMSIIKKERDLVELIEQIASQGRALGVHLIIAMQRPDADLLKSALKSNLRVRISGRQADATNAKVAGVPGAHEIDAGARGRMMIKIDDIQAFQGVFLDEEDCKRMIAPFKKEVPIEQSAQTEQLVESIFGEEW
ncbi:FtsK/SpoIIIE domain-containing protein [Priestia aryabhattai]|uniref:FtsK/SpoIIIE domain-containing protein n=1 Tax=Priestia aryabhattai TaxID=412384 RepID=UPI003D28EF88